MIQSLLDPEESDPTADISGIDDILAEMDRLMRTAFRTDGPTDDISPELLVTSVVRPPQNDTDPARVEPIYDLAYRTAPFNLSHMVRAPDMTLGAVGNTLLCGYEAARDDVRGAQPDGDWRLVGYEFNTQEVVQARVRRDAASKAPSLTTLAEHDGPMTMSASKQRAAKNRVLVLELVFAEVGRTGLRDVNLRHGAKPNVQMQRYIETRETRYMPRSMREERRRATTVMGSAYDLSATELFVDEEGNPAIPPTSLGSGAARAPLPTGLLARLAENRGRTVNPEPAPAPADPIITIEQLEAAQVLLDQGLKPGPVSAVLGVHHQTLAKLLRDRGRDDDDLDVDLNLS